MIRRNSFLVCYTYTGVMDGERVEGQGRRQCLTKTKNMRFKDVVDFEKWQSDDLNDRGYKNVHVVITSISRLNRVSFIEAMTDHLREITGKVKGTLGKLSTKVKEWRLDREISNIVEEMHKGMVEDMKREKRERWKKKTDKEKREKKGE